ncbi:ATP-binding cassette domain-containing protein [Streptomyces hoynatensis]|uniref:ABC-type xenobiotic transporter n=2 Tax=Streptomyces hoynatensis TaxID=1141874 RepID=A0A3A9ZE67_9ACTN|nr:ATP-binding cassette domain-containing protein [Streptomyces hoynatensis]
MPAGEQPAIEARGLRKTYGGSRALDGIDLTIRRGEVFGFLGPNGAGKTTTIRILATLTRPDGGSARVLGHDLLTEAEAIRSRVAVTGQFASLDTDLTGHENLLLLGRLHGLSRAARRRRAADLLDAFGLSGAAGRPVGGYSGGMRRRLDIAAGLLVTPDLLFLDEPTTGLDPRSRSQVWELVRRIAAAGTTVLLTTQYLEEADLLAERIAIVDHGRIVAEGTGAQIKSRVGAGTLHLRLLDGAQRPRARQILAGALEGTVRLAADPLALSVLFADRPGAADLGGPAGRAMTRLAEAGIGIADLSLGRPSLDEAFLALTGRRAGAAGEEREEPPA